MLVMFMQNILIIFVLLNLAFWGYCTSEAYSQSDNQNEKGASNQMADLKKATFGSGCFWCTEAVFERLNGVHSVVSGYAGGKVENPTYEEVCNGTTGHAEVTQITYDPDAITFDELLEVFWLQADESPDSKPSAKICAVLGIH